MFKFPSSIKCLQSAQCFSLLFSHQLFSLNSDLIGQLSFTFNCLVFFHYLRHLLSLSRIFKLFLMILNNTLLRGLKVEIYGKIGLFSSSLTCKRELLRKVLVSSSYTSLYNSYRIPSFNIIYIFSSLILDSKIALSHTIIQILRTKEKGT